MKTEKDLLIELISIEQEEEQEFIDKIQNKKFKEWYNLYKFKEYIEEIAKKDIPYDEKEYLFIRLIRQILNENNIPALIGKKIIK